MVLLNSERNNTFIWLHCITYNKVKAGFVQDRYRRRGFCSPNHCSSCSCLTIPNMSGTDNWGLAPEYNKCFWPSFAHHIHPNLSPMDSIFQSTPHFFYLSATGETIKFICLQSTLVLHFCIPPDIKSLKLLIWRFDWLFVSYFLKTQQKIAFFFQFWDVNSSLHVAADFPDSSSPLLCPFFCTLKYVCHDKLVASLCWSR